MAASGYSPISLYYSTTASAVPVNTNLVSGELALNITDGKLYYKDNAGTVQLLAGKGGAGIAAGSNTQIQFNNNGVFGASSALTFDGTTLTATRGIAVNSSGTATSGFYDGVNISGYDALGWTGSSTLVFGGYRSTQWSGIAFYASGSEQMRLTSTGLGIGTSSPSAKLDVNGTIYSRTGGLYTDNITAYSGSSISVNAGSSYFAVTVNSSERARIDSSGNLGLGVTPSAWYAGVYTVMDVGAASSFGGYAAGASGDELSFMTTNVYYNSSNSPIYKASGLATNYRQFNGAHQWYNAASGTAGNAITFTQAMTLDASGNLGIGETSPNEKLMVNGAIRATSNATNWTASAGALMDYYAAGTMARFVASDGTNSGSMFLTASGNLGLGVTPSAWGGSGVKAFDIGTAGGIAGSSSDVGVLANAYYNGSSWIYKTSSLAARYQILVGTGSHAWFTAGTGNANDTINFTQAMTLDASGRLGIGVTSPDTGSGTKLTVQGIYLDAGGSDAGYGWQIVSSSAGVAPMQFIAPTITFSTGSNLARAERARIDSSGNLLVGTQNTTPSNSNVDGFVVNPTGYISLTGNATSAIDCNRTNDGIVQAFRRGGTIVGNVSVTTTATTFNTSSDYRLKNTVAPMIGALAKVALLKPVTYKWNADGSDGEGFIAHELAEVVPQCVTGEKDAVDADGKPVYQGIDTSFLVATLTAAIKEQQTLIETLTARVAQLEAKGA